MQSHSAYAELHGQRPFLLQNQHGGSALRADFNTVALPPVY